MAWPLGHSGDRGPVGVEETVHEVLAAQSPSP